MKQLHADCIPILKDIIRLTTDNITTYSTQAFTAMNHLTSTHFILGDITAAAEWAERAYNGFKDFRGPNDPATLDAGRNHDLLSQLMAKKKDQQEMSRKQIESIQARAKAMASAPVRRVEAGASNVKKVPENGTSGEGSAAAAAADVEEIARYIQGQQSNPIKSRGKNALRGKKRTGAKR